MISKKSEKGLCPFRKLAKCSEKCILYRKGVRFNEKTGENFPFEACALNIIADNLEAMHQRTFMMQREVGETKNVIAVDFLARMGKIHPAEAERQTKILLGDKSSEEYKLVEDNENETKKIPE